MIDLDIAPHTEGSTGTRIREAANGYVIESGGKLYVASSLEEFARAAIECLGLKFSDPSQSGDDHATAPARPSSGEERGPKIADCRRDTKLSPNPKYATVPHPVCGHPLKWYESDRCTACGQYLCLMCGACGCQAA